jgi:dihydroorotate dehydrogenase electron transfer subunit
MRQRILEVSDQRALTPQLRWLQVQAPELARDIRPGQFVMVRCSEPGAHDPMLRRALFVAAAEPALGQVALLFAPGQDVGLRWLARAHAGDRIDSFGPLGRPFQIEPRTRTVLLVGEGPGVAALLLAAREALGRGASVTLLVAAGDAELLPPAFLLPGDVEFQGGLGAATDLLAQSDPRTSVQWADQLLGALPEARLPALRDAVQAGRMRWGRGFASVLIDAQLPCGVGTCGACAIELRRRTRLACADGLVFDLRDAVGDVH